MDTYEIVTPVFPWVTFTCSRQQKTFCIPRESVLHCENFQEKDSQGQSRVDTNKTYVNFTNPNPSKNNPLYAVVEMPIEAFRDAILRPAYEGNNSGA